MAINSRLRFVSCEACRDVIHFCFSGSRVLPGVETIGPQLKSKAN
jgi:hypothetical protein